MLIKEVIYDLREILKKHSFDTELTNRYLYFLAKNARRTVIRQFIQRNPGESLTEFTQTIIMPLDRVDNTYEDGLGYEGKRTKQMLPQTVGLDIYKNVEIRPNKRISGTFEMIDKFRADEIRYAPKNFVYGYIDDNRYIYIVSPGSLHKGIDSIVVNAIFEDPKDAEEFVNSEVTNFYLSDRLWELAKSIVLNNFKLNIKEDVVNNEVEE